MKDKIFVLGLLGESQSGKDWISTKFINSTGLKKGEFEIIRCADVLKNHCETKYGSENFSVYKWENSGNEYREEVVTLDSGKSITRRNLIQTEGDLLLEENPNYVSEYIKLKIKETKENPNKQVLIVPDLRNSLETESCKGERNAIVKVTRPLELRYPKVYNIYKTFLKSKNVDISFSDYIKLKEKNLNKKLTHRTETSIAEVPESLINFNFHNSENCDRELSSLIRKLSSCI